LISLDIFLFSLISASNGKTNFSDFL